MKLKRIAICLVATALCGVAATAASPAPVSVQEAATAASSPEALNHAVAVFVASNIKQSVTNALGDLVATGVAIDTAEVRKLIIDELGRPYDRTAHDRATEQIEAAMNALAVEQGELMMAKAAAREGAVTLPSGVVVNITDPGVGTGAKPEATSTIAMRYKGTLPDGSVFDQILPDEAPMDAVVGQLAPGMAQGLQAMAAGQTAIISIPAELAYGHEGVPGVIPPDCPLQFEVQLIEVSNS